MKIYIMLLFVMLTSCDAGNASIQSQNLKSSNTNTLEIKKPYLIARNMVDSSYTRLGNQISFTPSANAVLTKIAVSYYPTDDCSGTPLSITNMGNGTTTTQQVLVGMIYTSTDQSNFALCNVYGGVTNGGCSTMTAQAISGTLKSIRYVYQFANQVKSQSQCYYDISKGYEAFGNYNPINSTCTESSACGLSQSYPVDNIIISNVWTWVSGDDTADSVGIYGTQGIPDSNNVPGARSHAISWIDLFGNLWLFGGGYNGGYLNDLWKYNPSTNQWTWMSGSDTGDSLGIYGTQGIADSGNMPGARSASISWIDSSGNLWLFGGEGYMDPPVTIGYLNDLWKYNPSTNQWTWVSGNDSWNNPGTYGTQGVANSSNVPGARAYAISWKDSSENLWLFGGLGYSANASFGSLNDLWKYNPSTNQWTWMSGSDAIESIGIYGTRGVESSINIPGARSGAISWIDSSGNLWLFGGAGFSSTISGSLNDLWKYNPSTNQWTWVSGSDVSDSLGVYGTIGIESTNNVPGARDGSISWIDLSGNLWLFGGNGYGTENISGALNDLWKYNPTTNQWTWVSGTSMRYDGGSYGNKGVPSSSNIPGARNVAISWMDSSGEFWMFGGITESGNSNDLWIYKP